ncbi:MAG: signal recognition particle protein [bacterium]
MFDALTSRLSEVFDRLRGRGTLTAENVSEALREVRRALLEADVNVRVARSFIEKVKERALGEEVIRGVNPGQQMVRAVKEELVELLGGEGGGRGLDLKGGGTARVLLLGLQGSGKTTLAGKFARRYAAEGRSVGMLGLDVHRPAAADQLERLAERLDVPVRTAPSGDDPVRAAGRLTRELEAEGLDLLLVDTAGRQTVDAAMMDELEAVRGVMDPRETLLVLDAMTGQDAVRTAEAFTGRIPCTGAVLTKLDGDARGGAALSLREVTGLPILYAGVGEDLDTLEPFHPERMAGRILGMGDVVSLVEKAAEGAGGTEALAAEGQRFLKGDFDLEDFRDQLDRLRSMGPLQDLVGMLPGGVGRALAGQEMDESALGGMEAMIDSMTPEERRDPRIIDGCRRRRIARGSGRSVQEVNGLLKQFEMMRKMTKALRGKGKGRRGRLPFPPMS